MGKSIPLSTTTKNCIQGYEHVAKVLGRSGKMKEVKGSKLGENNRHFVTFWS